MYEAAAIPDPIPITLILGGARSGKSRHAEQLLTRHPPPWTYVATAQPFDGEMQARIDEHRARRGDGWRTVEAPVDLAWALLLEPEAPVLVDCLTLWLTNLMLGDHEIAPAVDALEAALAGRRAPTILVGSEVGLGIVPETKLGRAFRLHQRLAAGADRVLFMVAGLPMIVK
jgi:adenosyl cobinamide kinase/adenosyl cobinamide phosphate guanylyltransferase